MVAPTGAGKTAVTVFMMQRAYELGKRALFIVHQNELLTQTSKALWLQKLEHGMIASGKARSKLPVQVASVQTLVNRLSDYEPWDLIVIDEAHRSAANTYKTVLKAYPKAKVIGLTATPARTDGQGLKDLFQTLVEAPNIRELIEAGYLCNYDLYAPPINVDLTEVKITAGDYNKGQLETAMDKPKITGDAVEHYLKIGKNKRCVVMCVTINHAHHVAEQYKNAGISAAVIEGTMTNKERESIINYFKSGKIKVLTNVQLLIEGLDVPSIEIVQWLRPTQSLIVWMQGNGRGFRQSEGKDRLLILDHVNNCQRHGLPDQDRIWSLDARKKRTRQSSDESDIQIKICEKCFHTFKAGLLTCPKCGTEQQPYIRKIEEVDGELKKVEKMEQKKEQGSARTLYDLVQIGLKRNMNNPTAWAANVYAARQGRKPNHNDYQQAKTYAI